MRLGVVGHAEEKFDSETRVLARTLIGAACERYGATLVVSGHSPMGGVDIWAEEVAAELGIPTLIHAPKIRVWGGPGGFKERNEAIARDSDLVLCVVVEELPADYHGMRFKDCYHCKGRVPRHVKSGGCWTAWRAPRQAWGIIRDGGIQYFAPPGQNAWPQRPETPTEQPVPPQPTAVNETERG